MSSVLRNLSKHTRSLSAASRSPLTSAQAPRATRAFHSPFAVLSSSESPLTRAPSPTSATRGLYEKNIEYSSEPFMSAAGHRTYVVSSPDPANTPYEVPSGAYPTSAPYENYTRTESPVPPNAQYASTAPGLAHPITNKVPRNDAGVGELPDVNDSPLHENAPRFSQGGVDNAWKERK